MRDIVTKVDTAPKTIGTIRTKTKYKSFEDYARIHNRDVEESETCSPTSYMLKSKFKTLDLDKYKERNECIKDDQESVGSDDSGVGSIYETKDHSRNVAYNDFLNGYRKKQPETTQTKKVVRSEIFIQVVDKDTPKTSQDGVKQNVVTDYLHQQQQSPKGLQKQWSIESAKSSTSDCSTKVNFANMQNFNRIPRKFEPTNYPKPEVAASIVRPVAPPSLSRSQSLRCDESDGGYEIVLKPKLPAAPSQEMKNNVLRSPVRKTALHQFTPCGANAAELKTNNVFIKSKPSASAGLPPNAPPLPPSGARIGHKILAADKITSTVVKSPLRKTVSNHFTPCVNAAEIEHFAPAVIVNNKPTVPPPLPPSPAATNVAIPPPPPPVMPAQLPVIKSIPSPVRAATSNADSTAVRKESFQENIPQPPPAAAAVNPMQMLFDEIKRRNTNLRHVSLPEPTPVVAPVTAPPQVQICAQQVTVQSTDEKPIPPPIPPPMVNLCTVQCASGAQQGMPPPPPPPPMVCDANGSLRKVHNASSPTQTKSATVQLMDKERQSAAKPAPAPLQQELFKKLSEMNRKNQLQEAQSTQNTVSESHKSAVESTPVQSPQKYNTLTRFMDTEKECLQQQQSASTLERQDPKKRIVYNVYREMLGSYNAKANEIVSTLPSRMVREDQGVKKQLESLSQGGQVPPAPPPPPPNFAPPPPPAPTGNIPAVRLKSEISDRRMEPPACVQNAMMTKDKKPFTYTPGGLDLSQIRSPRMARRIERNAHSEGVSETPRPPQPLQPQGPLPPSAMAAMQPQLPVQVFPSGGPPPPPPIPQSNNHHVPKPPPMRAPSPANTPQQQFQRPDIKIPSNPTAMLRPTAGLNRPSFEDFDKDVESHRGPQPTAVSPRYDPPSPETQTSTAQLGSLYIPPVEGYKHVQAQQPPPPPQRQIQSPASPQSPIQGLNKAPTPWLQKTQVQPTVPSWAVRSESVTSPPPQMQQSQNNYNAPAWSPSPPISQSPGPRMIPIQFEATPVQPQQQQRMVQQQSYQQQQQSQQRSESTTTRIIPIQIEGAPQWGNQQPQRQMQPVYVHNKFNPPSGPNTPSTPGSDRNLSRQQSWTPNPTQSNAFKMIQKITNTDGEEEDEDVPVTEHGPRQFQQMPTEQVRKLNMTDSDRQLMNRVRQVSEDASFWQDDDLRYRGGHIPSRVFRLLDESGVDNETYLHNEVDPRYRGAAIPSRAFRMLQNMTDGASDMAQPTTVPRGQPNTRGPQMREHIIHTQIEGNGPPKPYIPPSEQTVQEPRKYTGSAIPSRSFKMLQAMTAPENCAVPPTENNENFTHDPSNYGNWAYDPNYAPPYWPYPPYWGYYDPNAYAPSPDPTGTASPNPNLKCKSSEDIPVEQNVTDIKPDQEKHISGTETPCSFANDANYQYYPYWDPYSGYQEQPEAESTAPTENGASRSQCTTPAYWDPYGYPYYYGYPPMYPYPPYSPYFFYQNASDPEDVNGYSSNDEMSYYASKFSQKAEQNADKITEIETPSIIVTPTPTPGPRETESNKAKGCETRTLKTKKKYLEVNSDSESDDTEVEDDDDVDEAKSPRVSNSSSLQSIPSVTNIKIYEKTATATENDDSDREDERDVETETETEYEEAEDAEPEEIDECEIEEPESEETSEETPDDDDVSIYINTDGIVPHQLSVIFEESERGSRAGSKCEHSMSQTSIDTVVSEGGSTSTIENVENDESDDEEDVDPESSTVTVRLPLKLKFSTDENDEAVTTVTVGDSEVNTLKLPADESEKDVHAQVTLKSPSRTPTRDISPFISEEDDENVTVTVNVRSRSSSVKRVIADPDDDVSVDEHPLARTFSTDDYDTADSDAEVSVCISIPLSAKKSSCDLDDSDESDVSDEEIEIKKSPKQNNKPVLPQTINKDEDVSVWVSLSKEGMLDKEDQEEEADWTSSIKSMESEAKKITRSEEDYEEDDEEEEEEEEEDNEDETKEVIKVEVKKIEVLVKDIKIVNKNEDISDDESESSESSSASSSDSSLSSRKGRRQSVRKSSVKEKQSDSTIVDEKPIINDKKEKEQSKISATTKVPSDNDINNNDKSDSTEPVFEKPESKVDLLSIKDRIAALQKASKSSYKPKSKDNSKMSVKDRVSMIEEIELLAKEIETTEVITGTTNTMTDTTEIPPTETPAETTITTTTTTTITTQKSTKGSVKSSEEFSEEEEVDSGVTSDMSRHISETDTESDCFPELRKMTRYQRAATHSRLFKLLQDECGDDDEEETPIIEPPKRVHNVSITRRNAAALSSDEENKESKIASMLTRRELLSLPLKSNPSGSDSFSSSGITSPGSPTVNEKLVAELVQSMLKRKKGRVYKNIPLEKLHAAALRILQEDMDRGDTVSSSEDGGSTHISPLRPDTMNSTPAQTPQEFYGNNYNDYCQLYESWNEATQLYDTHYDILPSRAFKILQEHAMGENKAGIINGLSAKCPRVLSSKSLHKEIEKLLESAANTVQSNSPIPEHTLAPKEATAS